MDAIHVLMSFREGCKFRGVLGHAKGFLPDSGDLADDAFVASMILLKSTCCDDDEINRVVDHAIAELRSGKRPVKDPGVFGGVRW